jgi:sulfotransferase
MVQACKDVYNTSEVVKSQPESAIKGNMISGLTGLVEAWPNEDVFSKVIYVDKSRAWVRLYPLLTELIYQPKIIVTIRDLRDVYASMEQLYRDNKLNTDPITLGEGSSDTVEDRVIKWSTQIPVGDSINALKNAYQVGDLNNMLIIKYEDLVANTQEQLDKVYTFLKIDKIKFTLPIENVTPEDDRILGIPGLHAIRSDITPSSNNSKEILGEELYYRIYDDYLWYNNLFGYER